MKNFRTGTCVFSDSEGDEPRWFIEDVDASPVHTTARAFITEAFRDVALERYRASNSFDYTTPGHVGTTLGIYKDVKYDDEAAPRFALKEGTYRRLGDRSFFITDTEHPGRGWGLGVFSEGSRQGRLEDARKMLQRFRDGSYPQGDWNLAFVIAESYSDIVDIDPEHDVSYGAAQSLTHPAEQKLDALWDALFAKAKELGWCEDFDTFAKANGVPERFFKSKVRVTVELEVNSREPDDEAVSDAMEKWNATSPRTITNWEVIA